MFRLLIIIRSSWKDTLLTSVIVRMVTNKLNICNYSKKNIFFFNKCKINAKSMAFPLFSCCLSIFTGKL